MKAFFSRNQVNHNNCSNTVLSVISEYSMYDHKSRDVLVSFESNNHHERGLYVYGQHYNSKDLQSRNYFYSILDQYLNLSNDRLIQLKNKRSDINIIPNDYKSTDPLEFVRANESMFQNEMFINSRFIIILGNEFNSVVISQQSK